MSDYVLKYVVSGEGMGSHVTTIAQDIITAQQR